MYLYLNRCFDARYTEQTRQKAFRITYSCPEPTSSVIAHSNYASNTPHTPRMLCTVLKTVLCTLWYSSLSLYLHQAHTSQYKVKEMQLNARLFCISFLRLHILYVYHQSGCVCAFGLHLTRNSVLNIFYNCTVWSVQWQRLIHLSALHPITYGRDVDWNMSCDRIQLVYNLLFSIQSANISDIVTGSEPKEREAEKEWEVSCNLIDRMNKIACV